MIKAYVTTHMTMNEFADALADAQPGKSFCYAIGDLADAKHSHELAGVKKLAWQAYENKEAHLTQRRREDLRFPAGGASFEYLVTKASPVAADVSGRK